MTPSEILQSIRAAGGQVQPGVARGVPPELKPELLANADAVRALVAAETCLRCSAWVGPDLLFCPEHWCDHPTRYHDPERKLLRCGACGAPAGAKPWVRPPAPGKLIAALRAAEEAKSA